MFDLVGIGNPVYDIIVTPETRTNGRVLSGCSTNACLAAKRLGMDKVGLIGCMGRDFAERFRQDMINYGIEAQIENTSKQTGGFHLVYDKTGDRTLDVIGVADKINRSNFPESFLESRFFLIGPILGEVDLELVEFIRSSTSATVFLDPQGLLRIIGNDGRIVHNCERNSFKRIASQVDFIKPNEHESETITGERDPVRALRQLSTLSDAVPIVTLAERGSLLLNDDELIRVPAYHTRALDPTGAGDVYAGSFITEYTRTGNSTEAALFASAAGSMMVEQVGPDFKITRTLVEERRGAIRNLLAVEFLNQ
jgi:sugar/nucleoside kinase (ribokinase family)